MTRMPQVYTNVHPISETRPAADFALMNEALAYAKQGWHVFPLAPGEKTPLLGGHGQKDATTDRDTIISWWMRIPEAGIGIACEPSGLYVIDIDAGEGKTGKESWAALVAEHGHVETYTVSTQSGGWHLYYLAPDGPRLKNTTSRLGPGIDTRGNGYVVAPPTSGLKGTYTVRDSRRPQPLPEWIVEELTPASARAERAPLPDGLTLEAPRQVSPATALEVFARVSQLAEELRAAPEGQGNDTAARVAFMAGQYVGAGLLSEEEAVDVLLGAISGWVYREAGHAQAMRNTIIRQVQGGSRNPREWKASVATNNSDLAPDADDSPEEGEGAGSSSATGGASLPSDWSTDIGQAEWLAGDSERPGTGKLGRVRYVSQLGWFRWTGQRWAETSEDAIRGAARKVYRREFSRLLDKLKKTPQDDKILNQALTIKGRMSNAKVTAALALARSAVLLDAAELDAHPDLLNTPSGVVDLPTGDVRPHDPALFLTKITRGSYRPGYTHHDWQKALEAIPDDDTREYVQLRMGQAATGRPPASDDAVFLLGEGSNGKSLLASDGVMPALGGYAMLADPGLIIGTHDRGASPERASLRGARFVLIEELPEGGSVYASELKRILGTSSITARQLYRDPMTFDASHSLFVTSNYLPTIAETDDGTWRRLCPIRFPYEFVPGIPETGYQRSGDGMLKARVKQGADGRHDAIVTWLVEGAKRLYSHPETIMRHERPPAVVAYHEQWRRTADRIAGYLTERIKADRAGVIARPDLYYDFTVWLSEQGHREWSQETFSKRLQEHAHWKWLGAEETQLRGHSGLSRPLPSGVAYSSALPNLSSRPRVFRGVRFAPR